MALTQMGTITVLTTGYATTISSGFGAINNTGRAICFIYQSKRVADVIANGDSFNARAVSSSLTMIAPAPSVSTLNYFYPIFCENFVSDNSYGIIYMNNDGIYVKQLIEQSSSFTVPVYNIYSGGGISSINLSTVDPNTTIEALVDGTMTEINNTPKTVDITEGDVIIDVSTHSPKDNYTVQVNNGDNMLRIVDDSTQYNLFPASIPVSANKTLTAYGEPDKEITINYTNTGTPVVTNT